jgi:uncharacterized membrane protein YidH (DUF202 family)
MTRHALAIDRGLQPERTVLAWTRTSLAVLVTGGLLVVKDPHPLNQPVRGAVGAAAAVVAALVYAVGMRRRRTLATRPCRAYRPARGSVMAAGAAVVALAALVVAFLLLPLL